ncbi:DUF732 domain-containing protein [Actinoplanes sp. NPDC023801]|uniref:DUF732 domain-containing protein n=1 Tax=Actinoplanes sp. NPDC023801 TaxID=3154595 RepID=UPI0034015DA9
MRSGHMWVAGAAVAVGALAGCAGSEPQTPPTAASTPTAPRGAEFLKPGLRFSVDAEKAFREALAEVDGQLAGSDDALGYGMTICMEIQQAKTDAQVAGNAAANFKVDEPTAKAIVEAAKNSLCQQ